MTTNGHPAEVTDTTLGHYGEWITAYLRHRATIDRKRPRTIDTYRQRLHAAHHGLPNGLPQATRVEIERWIAARADAGWSESTQQLSIVAIRGFFSWMHERGHADWNPAAKIKPPSKPRRLPHVANTIEVDTILDRAPRQPRDIWLWSLLASRAGLRACEVSAIRREDIGPRHVFVAGKGAHERLVPTHPDVWEQVADLPPGRLTDATPRQVSATSWSCYNRGLGVTVGIHKLRGWFATTLWEEGVDLETIRRILGHASLATTQAYLGLSPERMAAAIRVIPRLAGESGGAGGRRHVAAPDRQRPPLAA